MNKNKGMLNIKRNERPGINGWLVQIVRRYNNKPYTVIAKYFNDTDYNDSTESLVAAKRYRDFVLPKYPPYCFSTYGGYFTKKQAEENFQKFLRQSKLYSK